MADQFSPLIQFSTPIRPNEIPQVVLRINDNQDLATAEAVLGPIAERLAPLAAGLVEVLKLAPAEALGRLQAAGLNPQVASNTPNIPQAPAPAAQPTHYGAPPAGAGAPQMTQTYNQAPAPAAPQQPAGPCWACGKNPVCKDCNGPTVHIAKDIRGKKLNLHECASGQQHKGQWCSTPIWRSKRQEAEKAGIALPQGLVYE